VMAISLETVTGLQNVQYISLLKIDKPNLDDKHASSKSNTNILGIK